jgi:hypothetical protein
VGFHEDEYRQYRLAMRIIQLEARTSAVCVWTRFSEGRVRRLFRAYLRSANRPGVARHRGRSPRDATVFFRTPQLRAEAGWLASYYSLLGLLPSNPSQQAARALPTVPRGETLCYAFELYTVAVKSPRFSFEHAILLLTALARGDELALQPCCSCGALIIIDRLSQLLDQCLHCNPSLAVVPTANEVSTGTGMHGHTSTPQQLALFEPTFADRSPMSD